MNSFVFYIDPGHGWLAVLERDLTAVGFTAADFTKYSYVSEDGRRFYLEEDCDAPRFLDAYRERFGEPRVTERHIASTQPHSNFIRRMPRNVAGQWKPFAR